MLHFSKTANGRRTPPVPYQAGMVAADISAFTVGVDYTSSTDIIEITTLPAGAQPIRAHLVGEGFTAGTTAQVALMDGAPGEDDGDRDLTADEFFAAQAVDDDEGSAAESDCLGIAPVDYHRGVGVVLSADEAAGAKTLTLVIEYVF